MIISISGKKQSGKDTVGKIIQYLLGLKELNNTIGSVISFKKMIESGLIKDPKNPILNACDFKIKKWADSLKDCVCIILGCTREQLEDEVYKNTELGKEWDLYYFDNTNFYTLDFINKYKDIPGYTYLNKCKRKSLTPRKLLQLLGTECGRNIIHPNIWVNSLLSNYKCKGGEFNGMHVDYNLPNWIITDTRFSNEINSLINKSEKAINIRVNSKRCNNNDKHESETALDNYKNWDYVIENDGTIEELIIKVKSILINEKLL